MREVGMGLDQSSPKTALVINNVALFVALVGGYHQLSWIISGNSIPNTRHCWIRSRQEKMLGRVQAW